MNSSEGQFNHDGLHSARGRTVGTFITNTLKGAVGSARKSFEGRRHRRSRRKSEDIDPLDRAVEIQDHNNHRIRNNNEKRQKTNSVKSVPEPETIDITNSDSDNNDDIVMEDNQIMEVSSYLPFLVALISFSTLLILPSL